MYEGPIVDTHHHLWVVRDYPWLTAAPSPKIFGESYELLRKDYLIDDLRADFGRNGVTKSVHMQAHYLPHDPVGETRWLQSVADRHGFPHGIAGHVHLAADNAEEILLGHCAFPNFRSIRDVLYWSPLKTTWQAVDRPDFCLTPAFRRGIDLLGKNRINFELQGFPNQFVYFEQLVGETPQVQFCLVHGGLLASDDETTFSEWEAGLKRLVDLPNLSVKCSGVNVLNWGTPRPVEAVSRQINTLLDMFGADRCFFGSNFPVEKLKVSYDALVAMLKGVIANRPEGEQRSFFHDTALRFYRI